MNRPFSAVLGLSGKPRGSDELRVYDHDTPFPLGFLGAHNSVHIVNFRRFLSILARYIALYNLPVEVIIAGNVCEGIAEDYPFARKLGFLDDSAELYRMVDAVVIPLEFSTGIKIKVAEGLAWNVPVLATRDAFDRLSSVSLDAARPDIAKALRDDHGRSLWRDPIPRAGLGDAKGGDRGGRSAGARICRIAKVDRHIARPRRAGVPGIAELLKPTLAGARPPRGVRTRRCAVSR